MLRSKLAQEVKTRQAAMTKKRDESRAEGAHWSSEQETMATRDDRIKLISFTLERVELEHELLYVLPCILRFASFTISEIHPYDSSFQGFLLLCHASQSRDSG